MEDKRPEGTEDDAINAYDALDDADELDPFEINFLPQYKQGRGPKGPFINQYGVLIGDHEYVSEESPLEQWTENTDPAVMAGDQWVHPYKDIGFLTTENREYFEQGIAPQSGIFMHPDKNAAYGTSLAQDIEEGDKPDKLADNTD
ncbi:DUF3905 domain-containing protein [Paenibacillus psychroresistens]|uniref:DUF3905 domain-containing protein n=1 Tax=Paenibacillus psychroresistens TaxID=1778678 RepID=A0A6B8RT35_9BACL|nr:DUF3905 domain-containing protein [Paenibacillus psychroresistens]QGQ98613.1 DUF3905 domain-containing protein [Paenibacillus psychroresistens]